MSRQPGTHPGRVFRPAAGLLLALLPVACHQPRLEPAMQTVDGHSSQHFERTIQKTLAMQYLLYFPPDYTADAGRRWPLLVFLHGSGERGNDLRRAAIHGPPKHIAAGRHYPFIVATPQCPADRWWDHEVVFALIDELVLRHRIDPDRIYLTGLSMGGFATWGMAMERPDYFAAIAPVCGGGNRHQATRLKDLPVWAFHGAEDMVVPPERSQELVEAIRAAGGQPRLTIYPGVGHNSWDPAYDDPTLYTWLRAQRRGQPPAPETHIP